MIFGGRDSFWSYSISYFKVTETVTENSQHTEPLLPLEVIIFWMHIVDWLAVDYSISIGSMKPVSCSKLIVEL